MVESSLECLHTEIDLPDVGHLPHEQAPACPSEKMQQLQCAPEWGGCILIGRSEMVQHIVEKGLRRFNAILLAVTGSFQ